MTVGFVPFAAEHVVELKLQPSQWFEMGVDTRNMSLDQGRELEARGKAWTARAEDGRLLCCGGIAELFRGRHGVAWAMLSGELGAGAHLAITRFGRAFIANSPVVRVESLVTEDAAGRGAKWATALGLSFNARMTHYGAASETVLLFERIKA